MLLKRMYGSISKFEDFNKEFLFFIDNEDDLIQKYHARGNLYENTELKIIQNHSEKDYVFYDIGANVGNHSIFIAKVLNPKKVYVFEANPATAEILKTNIALNNLASVVNTSYVGIGLGNKIGNFRITYPQSNNIGAAKLIESELLPDTLSESKGQVVVTLLDNLNICMSPDFVKIDVEGMEMSVLKGMSETLARYKPKIFIEVDNRNLKEFNEWIFANNYIIVERFKRYESNENFLIKYENNVSS